MSNREFTAHRTMLANAFATAGAELLEYMDVSSALAAIPNTEPPQYVVAGTLQMIAKVLPATDAVEQPTGDLTDEQYQEILRPVLSRYGMQRYLNGDAITLDPSEYRAIINRASDAAIAAHLARQPKAEQTAIKTWQERITDALAANPKRNFDAIKAESIGAEIADLRAYLARQAQAEPAVSKDTEGNYTTGDDQLDLLLGLTEDMAVGKACPDTGVWWHDTLEKLKSRLAAPVAPAGAQNAADRDLAYLIEYIPDEAVRNEAKRKLAAGAQNVEAIRNQAFRDAANKLEQMNDASGDAAAYDQREQNIYELEREHAISDCVKAVRSLQTGSANTQEGGG